MSKEAWRARAEIGGKGEMWDIVGTLQFEFLVSQGLKPHHTLLDVGCGSLRGGVHFIPYLDEKKYYGIDKQDWLIDAGLFIELGQVNFDKVGGVKVTENFDIPEDWPDFDFAIAQSLFCHLPLSKVHECIEKVGVRLAKNGRFFATFFDAPEFRAPELPIKHKNGIKTFPDRDPWHYPAGVLQGMAYMLGYQADVVPGFEHPRDQSMMVFYK